MIGAALVVLIAGGIGYWLGVGANVATVAAPVATTPVVYGFHWFGFPFFGFFFFLLFLFVIFAVIRRVAMGRRVGPGWYGPGPGGAGSGSHGHGYYGGPGPRGWNGQDIPPMADDMLQRWHRQAHGAASAAGAGCPEPGRTDGPRQARPARPPDIGAGTMAGVPKVLVVDDAPDIVRLTRDYLEHAGFDVVVARDGNEALRVARQERPDLIVLDLGLPGRDGLDVTRELRRDSNVPIVMLTARTDEADKIVGLELGADDYLTKPFSAKELVARVRAVLRRTNASEHASQVRVGDVDIDETRMRVTVAGKPVELTATEFQLLLAMARQPGRVFTRSQLLDAIRGEAFEAYERAIDAHVKNIRRKIEPDPRAPRYIQTVFGVGYRFAEPE